MNTSNISHPLCARAKFAPPEKEKAAFLMISSYQQLLEFTCMPVVMCLVGNCRSQLLQLCSQARLTASPPSSPSFSTSSSPPLSLSNPFSLDHPFFSRHYFRIRSSFCHFPHFLSLIITGVAIADSLTKDHFRFEEDWERLQQHGQLWSTLNILLKFKDF